MAGIGWKARLGEWDRGEGPRYVRLARAIQDVIDGAEVGPGTRLPPERTLARHLRISRTTVVGAYARLREEGLVESRQGSGSYVRTPASRGAPSAQERQIAGAFRRNVVFRGLIEDAGSTIELLAAHLEAPKDVASALEAVAREDAASLMAGHGYLPSGLPALRQAVAARLTRGGLPTREAQVLITSGAQQAIVLAAALHVDRGDTVAVENPTYLGALDVLTAAGARLVSTPVTSEGTDVGRLRELAAGELRLIYLIPTVHNPTGAVLSERARREVARLVEETGIPLVEDHALADLVLGSDPPPPIASFARADAPVMTIGSLSKLFWGGLRVGWLRASEALVERLARFKAVYDLGSPVLSQAVAARLLPHADRVRAARCREIGRKLDALTGELKRHLPEWTWRRPAGGLLLWARIPRGNADELAQVALRHGVALVPGAVNSPDGRFSDHVRLPFSHQPLVLQEGVARLARAWREYEPAARPRRTGLDVID